ncbi:putative fructokinase [Asticcacaulis biprosthecium C19]|uniref:fructokinase n=1 Tax=Asticcacaulis biprosthecium C19 TaxID=715226 RepID=F4QK90_9CAUL|nr:ROK family protein [Asticcacaulis biprosthecium]EGF93268.1 putative fructokinase [Asticcacaulis biprosthecium C19]
MAHFACIELGGTKVNLSAGSGPDDLSPVVRLPTLAPASTLIDTVEHLRRLAGEQDFDAIGIASFGPVGLTPGTPSYGHLLKTPKPGWSGADLLGPIAVAFPGIPIALDTDVNGAALGEARWGGAQGLDNFAYVTVGTGIGVGLVSNGRPVHGLLHPEAGHIRVRRQPGDTYAGHCPFHGDCLEGMACGPAIQARTGKAGETLSAEDAVWTLTGRYLAELFHSLILIASPQRILVGGGVGLNETVLSAAREAVYSGLRGYIEALETLTSFDDFIQPAHLGDRAGIMGALALAQDAWLKTSRAVEPSGAQRP